MLPLMALLRRPPGGGACCSPCSLATLRPALVATALPSTRLFSAGPAPKQKSSKMRKKLRMGASPLSNRRQLFSRKKCPDCVPGCTSVAATLQPNYSLLLAAVCRTQLASVRKYRR